MIDFKLLLPILFGFIAALANLSLKIGMQSFEWKFMNFFNSYLIAGFLLGAIGTLLFLYSLQIIELWKVILIANVVSSCSTILLSTVVLHEPMSMLKSLFVFLTILFLAAALMTR